AKATSLGYHGRALKHDAGETSQEKIHDESSGSARSHRKERTPVASPFFGGCRWRVRKEGSVGKNSSSRRSERGFKNEGEAVGREIFGREGNQHAGAF